MTLDQRRQKTGSNFSTSSSSRAPLGHPPAGTRQAPPSPTPYPPPAFCQHLPASSPRGQQRVRLQSRKEGDRKKTPRHRARPQKGRPSFSPAGNAVSQPAPAGSSLPREAACPESKKWTAAGAGRGPSARPGPAGGGGGSAPSLRRRLASPPRRPPPACGGPARMGAGVSTYGSAAGGEEGEGCSLF